MFTKKVFRPVHTHRMRLTLEFPSLTSKCGSCSHYDYEKRRGDSHMERKKTKSNMIVVFITQLGNLSRTFSQLFEWSLNCLLDHFNVGESVGLSGLFFFKQMTSCIVTLDWFWCWICFSLNLIMMIVSTFSAQEKPWCSVEAMTCLRGCYPHRWARWSDWARLPGIQAPAIEKSCLWRTCWPPLTQTDRRPTRKPRTPLKEIQWSVIHADGQIRNHADERISTFRYLAFHWQVQAHLVVDLPSRNGEGVQVPEN